MTGYSSRPLWFAVLFILLVSEVCGQDSDVAPPCEDPFSCGVLLEKAPSSWGYFFKSHAFTWNVAVFDKLEEDSEGGIFGGTLIYPHVVLTAAHRVIWKNPQQLKIKAGSLDLRHVGEERNVSKIIVHENFGYNDFRYDFALLILDAPFDMCSTTIGLICLPEQDQPFEEAECTVSGWGKTGINESISVRLQMSPFPTFPHHLCAKKLQKRLGPKFRLDESMMCAGPGPNNADVCYGDGGGPLSCKAKNGPEPSPFVIRGVISAGLNCDTRHPALFADVAKVRDWIDFNIAKVTVHSEKIDEIARANLTCALDEITEPSLNEHLKWM